MKNLFFVLFVAYNIVFYKPDVRFLPYLVVVVSVVLLGYLFAEIQQNRVDYEVLVDVLKGFSPLVLLLWIKYYNVIKLSLVPAFLIFLILTILYILASSDPVIEGLIWNFMTEHDNVIMMSHRSFYGIEIFGMYYKSMVCLTFALGYFYYSFINCAGRKRYLMLLPFLLGSFAFLVSGTRSSMMLPFFLIGLIFYQRVRYTRYIKYLFYPLLVLFAFMFLFFLILLATETTETSNMIKYAHLESYMKLFDRHPIFLLLGQGPGTSFYSSGFGRFTTITEWTYVELLRNYGIWCIGILAVILKPLYTFYQYKEDNLTFVMMVSYLAYLFVAGTNPLLISSTGMLMVLSAYSYEWRLKGRDER
ncbi:ligase [Paraprevotella xylaniphila]|uniref:ligase n=1 Tax=Paraprevotella xylaniphila TaxID=454155 RepID=UPI0026DAC6C1|nr:ligase [Paraprevotella xylaniphila]